MEKGQKVTQKNTNKHIPSDFDTFPYFSLVVVRGKDRRLAQVVNQQFLGSGRVKKSTLIS